jgi:hypothetical protein
MIGNKLEGYSKEGYDVVKEKTRCSVSSVVESGHSFCPFGKFINGNNDVFVDAPFTKRAGSNDKVEKSGGSSSFVDVELTLLTSFHSMNAIMKQGRPKVIGSDNLLSSGYAQKMAPTCVVVAFV